MGNKDGRVYKKLRESARGEMCNLRIVAVCNFDPETTVLAHLDSQFKGMAMKGPDYLGVFACSNCHAALDGHKVPQRHFYMLVALQRQLKWWFDNGYLEVA
tara:strand:- start:2895 stop:3197 length:303 start_codon:yes stop_codon:yes gene_type:complete